MRSAASDTLQGRAIQEVNSRWGEDYRQWNGRESIGIPVCKKKYSPFVFIHQRKSSVSGEDRIQITVKRMYGCHVHSHLREKMIKKHGEREGWESFGIWSLAKAKALGRREMVKVINEQRQGINTLQVEDGNHFQIENAGSATWKHLCNNGSCAWKNKDKHDCIFSELQPPEKKKRKIFKRMKKKSVVVPEESKPLVRKPLRSIGNVLVKILISGKVDW